MGQIIINYPNDKAVRIYTALAAFFDVPLEELDIDTGEMVPRANADIKADCDQALRQFLVGRLRAQEKKVADDAADAAFNSAFIDPGLTE